MVFPIQKFSVLSIWDRLAKRVEIEQPRRDIVINCWSPPLFSTCHEIDILPQATLKRGYVVPG